MHQTTFVNRKIFGNKTVRLLKFLIFFLSLGFELCIEGNCSVFLSLVDIRLDGLTGVIQGYVNIPADFGDFMNPLFDSLGAPVSP